MDNQKIALGYEEGKSCEEIAAYQGVSATVQIKIPQR